MNVKLVFLNGMLEEEIYIEQPLKYVKVGEEKKSTKIEECILWEKESINLLPKK